jgi:hypothetical protein
MLLKRQQDGFGGKGNLYMHVVTYSARILTDGSSETASTLKIVSDVAGTSTCGWNDNDEAAGWAASSRELAFRLLYIRRPGAGIRRLCTPGRKVGGLFQKARGDVRIRGGHCKFEKGCRLFRQIFLARHNLVPATNHELSVAPGAITHRGGIRSRRKVQK